MTRDHLWPCITMPGRNSSPETRSSAYLATSASSADDNDAEDVDVDEDMLAAWREWRAADIKNDHWAACHTPIYRFASSVSLPGFLISMLRIIGYSWKGVKSV